jgi:hypothetical protein
VSTLQLRNHAHESLSLLVSCWSELASTAEKAEVEVPTGPVPATSLDGLCGGVTTIVGMSAWPCDDDDEGDGCGEEEER